MLFFKSDGRYNYYNKGYRYIAEFKWSSQAEREQFRQICEVLEKMYGPHKQRVYRSAEDFVGRLEFNEHWYSEVKRTVKRRRIYFREETSLSMALLKM